MFRVIQHLLPRAKAWRTTIDKALRRYLEGLGGFADEVREFVDLVYLDLFPTTTRELAEWETQFALVTTGNEATRRIRLAAAWAAQGGQSPDYLQRTIQESFPTVFIHEWWESGPPFVARDPREHTTQPLIGFYQCEASTPWECFDPGPGDPLGPHCDNSLANVTGYIVNLDLTRRAPPPVPDDPATWPYFLYFGGETFGNPALVEADRIAELEALILSLRPAQQWIVLMLTTIAIQTSGSAQSPGNTSAGFTTSVTLGPGSNRLLLVATCTENVVTGSLVTSVEYNGIPLDTVTDGTTDADFTDTDFAHLKWWVLREADLPADGAHDIVTVCSNPRDHGIFWFILEGASQAAEVRSVAMADASGTSVTAAGLVTTKGEFVAAIAYKNVTGATTPTQTIDGADADLLATQDHSEGGANFRVFSSLSSNGTADAVAASANSVTRAIVAITISRAL